jgi:hypothetical protein
VLLKIFKISSALVENFFPELSIVSRMSTEKFNRLHFFGVLQNHRRFTTSLTRIAPLIILTRAGTKTKKGNYNGRSLREKGENSHIHSQFQRNEESY